MVSSEKNNISNHFYSTLEGEERRKGRERKALCGFNCFAVSVGGSAQLIVLTQPGPCAPGSAQPRWSGWASADGICDRASAI